MGQFSIAVDNGKLIMNGAEVGRALLMHEKAIFNEVDLTAAKIGGQLRMEGSTFDGTLIMNGTEVGQCLFMCEKAIFKEVDLTGAKIGGQLCMVGSTFNDKLTMNGTEVGQALLLHEKATFKEVDLEWAKIGGLLAMGGSTFDGKLTMYGTEVGQALLMHKKATFKEVDLTAAKIGGQLALDGSIFDGKLTMNRTEVGRELFMHEKAIFKEVDLTGAKIGGQLCMDGSTFNGKLTIDGAEVGESLLGRSAKLSPEDEVLLRFARIGSDLDLSGSTIRAIDLTATTVTSGLRLSSAQDHKSTQWVEASRMVLRNTTVGTIQVADFRTDSWPEDLELEGFAYRRLGGLGTEGQFDISKREWKWFNQWLERDKSFSPQPYEQLASLLRESGYPSKANAILYAGRRRSREAAKERRKEDWREWSRWIWLVLLDYTIGYGLGARYFKVLLWVVGFTLIGLLILLLSMEKANRDIFKMAWASLDQVLPMVTLNESHEALILETKCNLAIGYFYLQKLVGYFLGGFLVAGLAGLTQKS